MKDDKRKIVQDDMGDLVEAFRILREMRDESPFIEPEASEDSEGYHLH